MQQPLHQLGISRLVLVQTIAAVFSILQILPIMMLNGTTTWLISPLLAALAPAISSSDQAQIILAPLPEADLICDGPKELRTRTSYLVRLAHEHSLEDHYAASNIDIRPSPLEIFNYPDRVVYTGYGINEEILSAIRGDPGVMVVQCEYYANDQETWPGRHGKDCVEESSLRLGIL